MAIPQLPPFQLSTGPQVTDGRFQTTVQPQFGGDFFGRSRSASGIDPTTLIIGGLVIGAAFLIATGRLKI